MFRISPSVAFAPFILLSACGGSSTNLQSPINAADVTVTTEGDVLSISGDGIAVEVPKLIDSVGLFETGELNEPDQAAEFVAAAVSENTFAALVVTEDDIVTTETYFGRTAGIDSFPNGTAIFEGDYFGTVGGDEAGFAGAPITGRASLRVEFDDGTVAGFVDRRVVELDILGGMLLPFTMSTSLLFDQTALAANGTFVGNITVLDSQDETINVITGQGTFEGTLGGANANEAVGSITITTQDGDDTYVSESGVFAARQQQ